MATKHDIIIIGGGPAGYVGAIRAAQLGKNVACIEKYSSLGGTCLNVGCIPSKALLDSSHRYEDARHTLEKHGVTVGDVSLDLGTLMKRKDRVVTTLTKGIESLFKKNKVTRYQGVATFTGKNSVKVSPTSDDGEVIELEADHIIIATGSKPMRLKGIEYDDDRIGTSTEALAYKDVPEHLVVIGAGYIGVEMGSVWARLGSKVTVLEYFDRILPGNDSEVADEAFKLFKKQGMAFHLGCKVTGAKKKGKKVVVSIEGKDDITADRVLVCTGRVPNTMNLGLDAAGVETDDRGRIKTNDHWQTNVESIYAVGDVIQGPMLAHKAEEEAIAAVEHIVNGYGHVNYDAIPGVVYTTPEIASVGPTEDQLKEQGVKYRAGKFPFVANGRAKAMDAATGFVKVLADETTDRILAVHIIGPNAGDLIAEAVLAMETGCSAEDLARTCHAHPTLAEAVKEAALAVDGRAIHM